MATLAAILNQGTAAGQAVAGKTATPAATAGATSGTSSTTSDSATISANDFLTLLVTEMQNQDPTADVDPNEYINQLVNVNSLEQLISINQTLSGALGTTSTTTGSSTAGQSGSATAGVAGVAASSTASGTTSGVGSTLPNAIGAAARELAPGNLSAPAAMPAAQRVAQSLSGQL